MDHPSQFARPADFIIGKTILMTVPQREGIWAETIVLDAGYTASGDVIIMTANGYHWNSKDFGQWFLKGIGSHFTYVADTYDGYPAWRITGWGNDHIPNDVFNVEWVPGGDAYWTAWVEREVD